MYPIRFEPIYQSYVWGGTRIPLQFHRSVDLPIVAESWEIADRDDGMSVVANGPLKGKTLNQLMHEMGEVLVGRPFSRFPILTKIIDAKEHLSIQVHPDADAARKLNGEPKGEMWVALDECTVLAGLKTGVTAAHFKQAILENRAEEHLEKFALKKGEFIDIPSGRVHAICGPSLLYEVQQNSNTTYRLYDWGRKRTLHLDEGFASIRWDDAAPLKERLNVMTTPYFIVDRLDINHGEIDPIPHTFQLYFCIEGEAMIAVDGHEEKMMAGMSYLVPAAAKSIHFQGQCVAIRSRLP